MREIIEKNGMREAIREIAPTKIAVAYIGQNSEAYVDIDSIEAIIVRPTTGTNPDEVIKIASAIGWDKVHFLTTLHAKIYLGKDSVLLGSCNLSNNGLGDYGLHEIAAFSDSPETVANISGYFEDLKKRATEEFQDEKSKIDVIERLKRITPLSFNEFDASITQIPIIRWEGYIPKYTREGLEKFGVTTADDFISNVCTDAISITETCDLKPGQFILYWKVKDDGSAVINSIKWLYAHRVERNIVDDTNYSGLVIQLQDAPVPVPPFKIDDKFRKTFAALMNSKPSTFLLKNTTMDNWTVNKTIYAESHQFLIDLSKETNRKN
jgi:hypothetical protein